MLGSKLGWILSGRTTEITNDITEASMIIMTYGTQVQTETALLTDIDKPFSSKPNFEDF